MGDTVILQNKGNMPKEVSDVESFTEQIESELPKLSELGSKLVESSRLVDDIILKKYLHKLTDLEIIPLNDELKQISDIRLFKITEMVYQKLDYSVFDIEKGLRTLELSTLNNEFVEEQIAEYKEYNSLELWSDENFRWLSRRLTDILGVRSKIENCVLTASDDNELTNMLRKIVLQISPEASNEKIITLSQCFMKDMSTQQEENEIRQKIYAKWVNFIKQRGVK